MNFLFSFFFFFYFHNRYIYVRWPLQFSSLLTRIAVPDKTFFFWFRVRYLDEVLLKLRFKKSLDLQISSSMGYFKKTNAFLVYAKFFHETVYGKWCLRKSVRQTENGLERSFVKRRL